MFLLSWAAVFLISVFPRAQSVTPYIINATGGSYTFSRHDISVDWNIGEMTLVNSLLVSLPKKEKIVVLTNGLLQPAKAGGNGDDSEDGDEGGGDDKNVFFTTADIKVFPNPTTNYVDVQFLLNEGGRVRLSLFSAMGAQLYAKEIEVAGHGRIERIPVNTYPTGSYMLNVQLESPDGSLKKQGSYKIIKIN
jgi:hypothetical protein